MKNIRSQKIFVAGCTGFLGKRVVERLKKDGYRYVGTSKSLGVDFREKKQIEKYFQKEKPDIVINCATFIGGIKFGLDYMGQIFYNNVLINTYLIDCARKYHIKRFINPISNCSYPDTVGGDFKEDGWWDGPLNSTVLTYGFVKKGTWVQSYAYHHQYKMDFVNLLVPNMYGPADHFDEVRSHAMGALIKKIVHAKENNQSEVIVWGSGKPVREWLYVDDCVKIFIKSLSITSTLEPINIGQDVGISIKKLAFMIKRIVGYKGKLIFDATKPDGAPYKVMNVERMKKIFKWVPSTKLEDGVKKTVQWYYKNCINKKKK